MSEDRRAKIALLDVEHAPNWATEAVQDGGGQLTPMEDAEALLLWHHPPSPLDVRTALERAPQIRWVQLPSAGVDRYAAVLARDGRVWTCAKGVYAEPVAEHALALTLAGIRELVVRARSVEWGEETTATLYESNVTVIGGGGIAEAYLALLVPFRVHATVVRRVPTPMANAETVVGPEDLHKTLAGADVVMLAAALTPETRGMIGRAELDLMPSHSWLVNIARGELVDQDELVRALEAGRIGGAALDATDPEPLPPDHPLWQLDCCLITPHVGVGYELGLPMLARRLRENVRRFISGEALLGVVDLDLGY
jgi:phosphoglycerate dehydrogenase-like enzyme